MDRDSGWTNKRVGCPRCSGRGFEGLFGPQDRIKNDKRTDGRIGLEGSDRTIFDIKCFPEDFCALLIAIQKS